ncbi:MAG TPA: cation diffusion facilitator family transporter [Phycisphaerae bacterium]|nr:cation diffusion facilitator family transporter [Phycisphaerae bacterium]
MEPDVATPQAAAYRQAALGAWVGIVGNVFLGAAKLVGGILGTSSALVADAAHSLSDSISSIVVLWGLRRARRPADEKHPFGHGKAEFMAGRTVAVMLVLLAIVLGYRAIAKILNPPPEDFPKTFALWFVLASILIKEGMYQYKSRLGRRLRSESLLADAWHHRSDAFSSACAMAGISAALVLGHEWRILDPIAALMIVLIILGVGVKALFRTGSALMDEAADAQTLEAIRRAALTVDGVLGTEKLISRRSGLETHAELHVEVDPGMPVGKAHEIATKVTRAICRDVSSVSHVTVHIEPYYPGDH